MHYVPSRCTKYPRRGRSTIPCRSDAVSSESSLPLSPGSTKHSSGLPRTSTATEPLLRDRPSSTKAPNNGRRGVRKGVDVTTAPSRRPSPVRWIVNQADAMSDESATLVRPVLSDGVDRVSHLDRDALRDLLSVSCAWPWRRRGATHARPAPAKRTAFSRRAAAESMRRIPGRW
jgi:hypothetical protein